jgi:hypothetical protein
VPSSTSNFNNSGWCKSWILGLIIAAVLLGGLEYVWRINGHQPAIVDDQRLWAMERSKVGKSPKEIVLLGSSRIQTDISMATLRRVIPDYSIINLPIDGTCANAALHDLAADDKFSGTVIMETTSECLMFGYDRKLSQQSYVDYYHRVYNLNVKANRLIATFLQKKLTIIDPYLNLIKVAGDIIRKKKWREPNYLTTYEDRTRAADYTKLDIGSHKIERLQHQDTHYRQLAPRISTQYLTQQVKYIDSAVRKINNRGGKVVFVRFPVSDEHWDIDEQYFPRTTYWDTIIPLTRAEVIHFKDIDTINKLQCPDTSHLDVRDTAVFTTQLFNKLLRKKII